MSLSREQVHQVATLARLELSESEEAHFAEQLGRILDYIERLAQLDTEGVEPTAHIVAIADPLRDDVVTNAKADETLLRNAPALENRQFRVPKIID
ncbi:MAG TPA: Asp-tRNA(Asn)/Glu-tRNA(Gln) amidotransferase subunit GatC [Terriglobales bacterium]|nr:Asp-tRNA(Asn)/Glu-tRNA(Gln) amidotransferase subunit GatC [Terriglobales bacterium]